MSKRKIDNVEALRRILRFDDDLLDPDYPEALIDEELREAGADPEEIGREGEAFVKKLMAEQAPAQSRKASGTRLRSRSKVPSSLPPSAESASSLQPARPKLSSDVGPLDEPE